MSPDPFSWSYGIMVIEDDEGYQELARALLKEYALTVCSSVEEALPLLRKEPFGLVLCDINLMGMTGLQLIGQLKSEGLTDKIPVVMCSSMADPATRAAAAEMGVAGFVEKPYDGVALQRLVKSLLPPK